MKRHFHILILLLSGTTFFSHGTDVTFTTSGGKNVQRIEAEKSTGLDAIFVAYSCEGLRMDIRPDNSSVTPVLYRYGAQGGGYAEPYDNFSWTGGIVSVSNPAGDCGYILEQGDKRYYFWLTDYSRNRPTLTALSVSPESDCGATLLEGAGNADAIRYYSINGRPFILSRDLKLSYNTLEWDEEGEQYLQKEDVRTLEYFSGQQSVSPPPYCDTSFILTGDRFSEAWGEGLRVESDYVHANAVEVHTYARQIFSDTDHSNQIGSGDESTLGGSAPAVIRFTAYVTDAVVHNEWQISADPEFEDVLYRFTEQDLEYDFMEEGNRYVKFIGSNADGTCVSEGDVYTVSIGASELVCPNAFSPGASEGVNDEWRVSYKSIVEFKCWIFDRYGTQIYYFDSPDGGWDGKYKGKFVKTGVYYYVIEARGAEGKKYKKSGDINILRFNRNGGISGTEEE